MAIEPLVPTFEDGSLIVKRGDIFIVDQPFYPATGSEPRRDWVDEADALAYWDSIKDQYALSGLSTEEKQSLEEQVEESTNN